MSSEWGTSKLGKLASIVFSSVDKHLLPGEQPVRLCNYLDVYRNRRLTSSMEFSAGTVTASEFSRFRLVKGDVLITKDSETPDDIGIPAVVIDDFPDVVCGYHLAMIRPGGDLDSDFLCHFLRGEVAKRHFLCHATGVTRFGLGTRAIASVPVHHPPRHQQIAVARILDALDVVIERTRDAVLCAEELRRSLLTSLLSRGVGQSGRVRNCGSTPHAFANTPLGRLPAVWRLSTVGSEFDLQNGFTLNSNRRPRFRKRRYLRVANVQRDALLLDDIQELEAGDGEFAPRALKTDDLLVVEGHADRLQIGRCARVTEEAKGLTFQNHLFRLRANGGVLPYFACLWLNSAYARRYWNARCATSSGLNTINQRMLKRLVIPVPPETEQRTITQIVSRQRDHIEALFAKQRALESLKSALLHGLLTGKVRVNHLNLDPGGVP